MRTLIFVLVLVLSMGVAVQAKGATGDLTVTVTDLRNDNGRLSVVLFNSPDGFPKKGDKAFKILRTEIKNKQGQVVFQKIPYGEYAIVILHDENKNGKMDYNVIGLPKEGYGFSNNATATLGPPPFKDAKFKVDKPKATQKIKATY
jgi:uncharacterized protein (DUF2141 family)